MTVLSQERAQHLTQKLVTYYVLYQTCSDGLRHLGPARMRALHDDAFKKWQSDPSNPLFEPPYNDEQKRALYFAKCDEICGMEPKTLDEYIISKRPAIAIELMACLEVILRLASRVGQGFKSSGAKSWMYATNVLAYNRYTGFHRAKEYSRKNPDVAVLPDSPDSSAIYPYSATTRELGPLLINETVHCRDQETGRIMEFTVQDYGTSHVKGEWFEVMYDDLTVLQITAGELKEMLANRVDGPQ